jgi:endo-1,4-beta-xylanase
MTWPRGERKQAPANPDLFAIPHHMTTKTPLSLVFALVTVQVVTTAQAAEPPALKRVFQNQFRVGAAIGTHQVLSEAPGDLTLVAKQFNTVTSENLLKWNEVHPERDTYNFDPVDRFVDLGEKNEMFIVGHNLVWHNQTPSWVFEDESGAPLTREALLSRMRDHIHAVVGRYKGRINAWDVVNEAIGDDGSMRKTKWQQIIGDDYFEKAYEFAHEADPQAELYYNDYNEWKPDNRQGIKKLIERLRNKNIRIDGLGLQGHWGLDYPSTDEIETMFDDYGKLGLKLMITELDVTVLPDASKSRGADITRNEPLRNELDPYPTELPGYVQKQLAERYAQLFQLFMKHADKIDRVTFWGVHDGHSWRNDWPVKGRHDYPLLFDRQLRSKPAFAAVTETAAGK